jgi:oxygen-independent coproporphyrinogen-3 oxidase
MASHELLRDLGLFDARAPRYTSYPPANHFKHEVGPGAVASWIEAIPAGARISLYVHIPYCRRLCWFCACRTQGTQTDRPLIPYLAQIKAELALVGRHLRPDVEVAAIHLGGGTPTILPPGMLTELCGALNAFRPRAKDMTFSVEIDPTEIDRARLDALGAAGLTRASIGVQDFDPTVQDAIGRAQGYELTRDVVAMIRETGVSSLNMDMLFGLPHQTRERMADSVQKVLSLSPDRLALYGYAHVPWMAKRQVMIPAEALPDSEERLRLFELAAHLMTWDGYEAIGIDHFARPQDALAVAAKEGRMRRNFQGYTEDGCDTLIGLGASAISRYPQGYAQNASTSSAYAQAIKAGHLATERGHAMSADDNLRADMIERLMCRFELDLRDLSNRHGIPLDVLLRLTASLRRRFADFIEAKGETIRLARSPRLIARLAALEVDAYAMPEGRHSRAL